MIALSFAFAKPLPKSQLRLTFSGLHSTCGRLEAGVEVSSASLELLESAFYPIATMESLRT